MSLDHGSTTGLGGEFTSQPGRCLQVTGLTKSFGGTRALDGVDLAVRAGEVHALLGENGSGKSTLIKILSGYHRPDAGAVLINGKPLHFRSAEAAAALGCRFVHQDLALVENQSITDNMLAANGYPTRLGTIRGRTARRQVAEALRRVGLDLDPRRLVSSLLPAEKTGVAIARALRDADGTAVTLLVLDEPTATLPDDEVRQLLDTVRAVSAGGVGVLYVTHRLDEVFDIADETTILRDGRRVITAPTADLNRESLVRHLVGREFEEIRSAADSLASESDIAALCVRNLRSGPISQVSFDARPGEIVGVAGITGSGRDVLLSAVFGGTSREGEIAVAGDRLRPARPAHSIKAGLAYLPADRKVLGGILTLSARHNLTLADLSSVWRPPVLRRRRERTEVLAWFDKLDIRPANAVDKPMAIFSGGNQQKVLLAKWLRCRPKVLLLDEPTQGVDVAAKAEIHRQVLAAVREGATAVVSSSDVDELAAICHRVLVLRNGRIAIELAGDRLSAATIAKESLVEEGPLWHESGR
jgi:ribose transport system ATP-binding protein